MYINIIQIIKILKLVLLLGLEPRHCANQAQGLHYRIGALNYAKVSFVILGSEL